MSRHSQEKKEHALSLMGPPHNLPVAEVSRRTGVSVPTLYDWRRQQREQGRAMPADDSNPENWPSQDKFAVVVETLPMNEMELAEYARQKGLYVEQILQWRQVCMQANDDTATRKSGAVTKAMERRRVHKLEQELCRKDKALAEAAALLVLSRKLEALYPKGTDGEE